MVLLALFPFSKKDPLTRLKTRSWSSDTERDALIEAGIQAARNQEDLLELLYCEDNAVRRASMRRLKRVITPAAVEGFLKISRDRPQGTVAAVAQAISQLLPDEAHGRAARHLNHRDPKIRKAAELYLTACPLTPQITSLARQWLQDEEAGRAKQVMEKVERAFEVGKTDPRLLMELVEIGLDHPNEHVRHIAWKLIVRQRNPAHMERFIEAIVRETYANQKILAEAIARLAKQGGQGIGLALLPLLGSSSVVLRTTAVNVLRSLDNTEEVIRDFVAASRDMPPLVRERALETLRDLGERAVGPLLELMESDDPELRMLAITMASTLSEDKRLLGPLSRALRGGEWWIKATAAETLGQMGAQEAIGPLKALLRDADVVWTAIGALVATSAGLQKAGNSVGAQEALKPLMQMLKSGQRDSGRKDTEEAADLRLEVVRALATLRNGRLIDILRRVAQNDLSERVRTEAVTVAAAMAQNMGGKLEDEARLRARIQEESKERLALKGIDAWLAEARGRHASDLHIAADQPVMVRISGRLTPLESAGRLTADQSAALIRNILSDEQARVVAKDGQLNLAYTVPGMGRYRANVFADYHGVNAVFRVIPDELPTLRSIGLPAHFADVQYWHQGLLLVCGASGAGKTTTLAALINLINEARESHILTVEDPIEFVHPSRRSLVNQRQLQLHTRSYARALRGALREDPDVIVIGELNDPETVSLALEASETGHLVIGTLNSTRAPAAVDRIVGSFSQDEQNQVRLALSESLKGVIAQSLIPNVDGSVSAVFEVLMGTAQVRNVIREGKNIMLESIMQTGQNHGMQTFDDALMNLVRARRVAPDEAARRARNKPRFEDLLNEDRDAPAAAPA